jgi:hypothetical protein
VGAACAVSPATVQGLAGELHAAMGPARDALASADALLCDGPARCGYAPADVDALAVTLDDLAATLRAALRPATSREC